MSCPICKQNTIKDPDFITCHERLHELLSLEENWDNGEGKSIDVSSWEIACQFLQKRSRLSNLYKIYPVTDGSIIFEFQSNSWDFTIFFKNKEIEMLGCLIDQPKISRSLLFFKLSDFLFEFDKWVKYE